VILIKEIPEHLFIEPEPHTGFNFPQDCAVIMVEFLINEEDKLTTGKGLRFDIDCYRNGSWHDVAFAQVEGYGPEGKVSLKHGINPNQFIRFKAHRYSGLPMRIRTDGNGFRSGIKISKMTIEEWRASGGPV
jgi:hypothetical protein